MVGPSFTDGGSWPSSEQKQANQIPAVGFTVTSRMEPEERSPSTMATWPIFGRMTVFLSTFTVPGP